MQRRTFIKTSALGSMAFNCGPWITEEKTHILTLSFDDGFKKSFYKVAKIYEEYDQSACFNVIASGHLPGFKQVDDYILPDLMGNFDDWNTLKARGHEVMPHSWKHLNLASQPVEKAKELIVQCLDYFSDHLEGYDNEASVFNFPYNSSTPELEEFVLSKVLALRSRELPREEQTNVFRQGCRSMGPENIDHWVEEQVNSFLRTSGGWLILNVHGLDGEGWGPMSSDYLDRLIKRLSIIKTLDMLPTGKALLKHTNE